MSVEVAVLTPKQTRLIEASLVGLRMNEDDTETTFDPNHDIDPVTGQMGSDMHILVDESSLELKGPEKLTTEYTRSLVRLLIPLEIPRASAMVTVAHDQS